MHTLAEFPDFGSLSVFLNPPSHPTPEPNVSLVCLPGPHPNGHDERGWRRGSFSSPDGVADQDGPVVERGADEEEEGEVDAFTVNQLNKAKQKQHLARAASKESKAPTVQTTEISSPPGQGKTSRRQRRRRQRIAAENAAKAVQAAAKAVAGRQAPPTTLNGSTNVGVGVSGSGVGGGGDGPGCSNGSEGVAGLGVGAPRAAAIPAAPVLAAPAACVVPAATPVPATPASSAAPAPLSATQAE